MTLKRISEFGLSLVLSLSSLLVIAVPKAHAATITWDGDAGDHLFSSATNWVGDVAPTSGDVLNFDLWVGPSNATSSNVIDLTNDLSSTIFGGVTGAGAISNQIYNIDTITVSGGSTLTDVDNTRIFIENLQSSGVVTLAGTVEVSNATVDGIVVEDTATVFAADTPNITVTSGSELIGSITQSAYSYANVDNIIIEKDAKLFLCGREGTATITSNITFGGGAGSSDPEIRLESCLGGGGVTFNSAGAVFTGTITLLSDAKISAANKGLAIKGTLVSNGHDLTVAATGSSKIFGNGTIGSISLGSGSIIAPGLSPGCLGTGNLTLVSGSSYEFEIGGTTECSEYDRINVTGTINLGNGTLSVIRFNNFTPTAGQTYQIIANDSNDAVTGTFNGLAEGATFTAEGYLYRISYVGGDGNDVVLTVVSVPATPNTGVQILTSNPLATLAATVLAAGAILTIAKKYNSVSAKK